MDGVMKIESSFFSSSKVGGNEDPLT